MCVYDEWREKKKWRERKIIKKIKEKNKIEKIERVPGFSNFVFLMVGPILTVCISPHTDVNTRVLLWHIEHINFKNCFYRCSLANNPKWPMLLKTDRGFLTWLHHSNILWASHPEPLGCFPETLFFIFYFFFCVWVFYSIVAAKEKTN